MSPKVQRFLLHLPAKKSEAAAQLRDLALSVDEKIEDTIKWNNLTFMVDGVSFAFIYTYRTVDYINFGFFEGVRLKDPKHLLEGTGKGMRHIKVYDVASIPTKKIQQWIKECVALPEGSKATKLQKKKSNVAD
jgi:hypothetical protein